MLRTPGRRCEDKSKGQMSRDHEWQEECVIGTVPVTQACTWGWVAGSTGHTVPSLTPSSTARTSFLASASRSPGRWMDGLSASLAARQARKELLMAEVGQATPNSSVTQG